jgi:hypothetical protein
MTLAARPKAQGGITMKPIDLEAIRARLTDPDFRADGAFSDSGPRPDDETWNRFGKPLFDDIDALLCEVDRLRAAGVEA